MPPRNHFPHRQAQNSSATTQGQQTGRTTCSISTPVADGISGSSDDIRDDDDNLHWFRKSNNNPFTIAATVDASTYSRNLGDLPGGHSFAANADRTVGTLLGAVANTEAVMQQGTYIDEAQRTLGHDDVATLRYAMSGINESRRQRG